MRIGVYVGTFSPVHKGHIKVINHLLKNNCVDKVIVIPTCSYWNKTNITPLKYRINMLKFYQDDSVIINETLNDIPYTYQILNKLEEEYLSSELYLIIGADNILKIYEWKNIEIILKYKILVIPRDNINIDEYIKEEDKGKFVLVTDFSNINISSTIIKNNNLNEEYLDNKVLKYINDNNLY